MPGPGQIAQAGPLLIAGLRADFQDTYSISKQDEEKRLVDMVDLDVPSDKAEEVFGYWETTPYPGRWRRGQSIPSKALGSRQFRIANRTYGHRIEWHQEDREDDQTKGLYTKAQELGNHFGTLRVRVFYQVLQNLTDPDLLESIPNAPDGAALYATTAEGADRFGVSNGNIQPGTGLTPEDIRVDFFSAVERLKMFRDPQGQPLWPDTTFEKGYKVLFGVERLKEFAEAFKQTRTAIGGLADAGNIPATNIVLEAGVGAVELVPTPRIYGDDWFLFLKGTHRKALVQMNREPLTEAFATAETSDQVRNTRIEYLQYHLRHGWGVNIPFSTVKIDN